MPKPVTYSVYLNGEEKIFYSWDAVFKFCQQNGINTANIRKN